jgi:hypothetical protein
LINLKQLIEIKACMVWIISVFLHHFKNEIIRFYSNGFLAQLVEQWIENPCVPGSIPGETTKPPNKVVFLFYKNVGDKPLE